MDDFTRWQLRIIPPAAEIDGAVAELHPQPDGTVTAEIRIPGPAAP